MHPYTQEGTILSVNDVHLAFEKDHNVVLRGVNGIIRDLRQLDKTDGPRGQINAIVGPSGVGKSQLFNVISGLPTLGASITGTVTMGENNVPVRSGLIGVVAQDYPLIMHRRVLGNLVQAGLRVGLTTKEANELGMQYLAEFDLADKANYLPRQLSGGQRQRVAILQQLMCSEHVMLLDEPFSGQDPLNIDKTIARLQFVANKDEYNTVVLVTHELSAAVAVADHIWLFGRDYTEEGEMVPGAYFKHEYNLIDEELAWEPDIRKNPRFHEFVAMLRDQFKGL